MGQGIGTTVVGLSSTFAPAAVGAPMRPGETYGPLTSAVTNAATVNGRLYLADLPIGAAGTISAATINVSTAGEAGAVVRLGIYRRTAAGAYTLVADWGTVAADSTGIKTLSGLTTAVTPGMYTLGAAPQNAATTPPQLTLIDTPATPTAPQIVNPAGTPSGAYVSGVTGALPASPASAGGTDVVRVLITAA